MVSIFSLKLDNQSFKILNLFIAILLLNSCNSNAQTSTISLEEFQNGITSTTVQLLDVRTAEEYQEGHLAGALQADWNNQAQFQERVNALDKTKPVHIYCLSGGRSSAAMQWMSKNGFATIYNLKGGINAWKMANKPVEGFANNKQMTIEEYQSLIPSDKTVLVDVGAKWCPPCKKMTPIIDSLISEKYTIIKIDGGTQTNLCKLLNIDAFPVFIVYKNGKEIVRKQGVLSKEELKILFH